jgi:hypothetical protein
VPDTSRALEESENQHTITSTARDAGIANFQYTQIEPLLISPTDTQTTAIERPLKTAALPTQITETGESSVGASNTLTVSNTLVVTGDGVVNEKVLHTATTEQQGTATTSATDSATKTPTVQTNTTDTAPITTQSTVTVDSPIPILQDESTLVAATANKTPRTRLTVTETGSTTENAALLYTATPNNTETAPIAFQQTRTGDTTIGTPTETTSAVEKPQVTRVPEYTASSTTNARAGTTPQQPSVPTTVTDRGRTTVNTNPIQLVATVNDAQDIGAVSPVLSTTRDVRVSLTSFIPGLQRILFVDNEEDNIVSNNIQKQTSVTLDTTETNVSLEISGTEARLETAGNSVDVITDT